MSDAIMVEGIILRNVHSWWDCQGFDYTPIRWRPCVIHNPSPHHMRTWPLLWRDDRGIFERVCPHGTGHPDPDQFHYWHDCGRDVERIHGCDGCCTAPMLLRKEAEWETGSRFPYGSTATIAASAVSSSSAHAPTAERVNHGR